MSKVYVYSTLSSDQDYGTKAGVVRIKGGANVSNKHLLTPRGVVTEITEEQLDALQQHAVFQAHAKNGFLTVSLSERKVDQMVRDMEKADKSAQETPETMGKRAGRAPVKKEG